MSKLGDQGLYINVSDDGHGENLGLHDMYCAILAVSINAIAFASPLNIQFIHSHDNLCLKLLSWPVILGLFLSLPVGLFS